MRDLEKKKILGERDQREAKQQEMKRQIGKIWEKLFGKSFLLTNLVFIRNYIYDKKLLLLTF